MRFQDVLWLGFKGLRERKLRAGLTVLSVVIGIAAIIALTSQTTGIQNSIVGMLTSLGPTSILVLPRGTQSSFTQVDVARISSIPGVESIIPMVSTQVTLTISGTPTTLSLMGVNAEGLASLLGEIKLIDGGIYTATSSPLAVVGYNVAFPTSQGGEQTIFTGQPLVLERQLLGTTSRLTVQVVGLLERYGAVSFLSVDSAIFLPLDAAMKLLNLRTFSLMLAKAADVSMVSDVAQLLTNIYGDSAQIMTIQQITSTVSNIIGQFSILLGAIAGISLSVAALGIMNIMLVTVYERTRVIGILKSIGFRNRDVLELFLSEAIIIGIAGGLLGLGAGTAVSNFIPMLVSALFSGVAESPSPSASPGQQGGGGFTGFGGFGGGGNAQSFLASYTPVVTPDVVIISIITAITVSIVAAIYPAWRASRLDPIKALRYE